MTIQCTLCILSTPYLLLQMLDQLLDRVSSLEAALIDANNFAEAERVRCEQTEAVIDSLLASSKMHFETLSKHTRLLADSSLMHSTSRRRALVPPLRATSQLRLQQSGSQTSRRHQHGPLLQDAATPAQQRLCNGDPQQQVGREQQDQLAALLKRSNSNPQETSSGADLGCSSSQQGRHKSQTVAEASGAGILMTTAKVCQVIHALNTCFAACQCQIEQKLGFFVSSCSRPC